MVSQMGNGAGDTASGFLGAREIQVHLRPRYSFESGLATVYC